MIEGPFNDEDIFRKTSGDAVSSFYHHLLPKQFIGNSSGNHNSSGRSPNNNNAILSETRFNSTD